MVLGNYVINDMGGSIEDNFGGMSTILLPLVISALGIVFSILGARHPRWRQRQGISSPSSIEPRQLGLHHLDGHRLLLLGQQDATC